MKIILITCVVGIVLARPQEPSEPAEERLGNPDEWGPYYQGDIRLPLPIARNGILDESYRWPNGLVPYEFGPTFANNNKATVLRAMQSYSDLTRGCIRFVPRSNERDYVVFVDYDDGCWSYVGRQGGRQEVNYPQWCINEYGSVQHEMYHALGFFHEQSRPDRDSYVRILWNNIQSGAEHNFDKYGYNYVGTFGENYDYRSVMHYSGYAFSKNGGLTIQTLDPKAQNLIGQRVGLSQSDINKLMNMYKC